MLKNEDDILNVLLDYVEECTKILNKFADFHPLYKILLGKNYLSNLKLILANLMEIFKQSNLILMSSPAEFLNELKRKYPNLIYLLCESYLNETLKKNLDFLPDTIKKAVDSANRKSLSILGDKLAYHTDEKFHYDSDSLFKYKQNVNLKDNSKPRKYKTSLKKHDLRGQTTKIVTNNNPTLTEVKSSSNESLTDEASKFISEPNPLDGDTNSGVSLKQYISKNKSHSNDLEVK